MTDITPADLARFIHPVPVGARFPMGLEVADLHAGYIRGPFRFPDSSRVPGRIAVAASPKPRCSTRA